ncbi:hypothetical protein D6D24_09995 [Aureobasidium pullulans]|uniref:Uncharacterized protein n=1 Tax=Aureobasidium pullulans TaxID=5580 RepID=A0A4S8V4X1_AURPU|nr:hypothetical protein D6D24_09995 [Aureobasidium pullulans]
MVRRSSSVDSNWCYVAEPGAGRPTSALTKAPSSEDESDPALQPLIKRSKSLKEIFKQVSCSYGSLKSDLRRAGSYFDNAYRNRDNRASQALANGEIGSISRDTIGKAQEELNAGKYRKQEFFGSYIMHHRSLSETLRGLLDENNALVEDIKRLKPDIDEDERVVRINDLLHSQKNLDFLINELYAEISAILSWKLEPRR